MSDIKDILEICKDRKKRVAIGRESMHGFLPIYFGKAITHPMAQFHHKIIDVLNNKTKNLVLVAFRGSGKSTLATLAYAIWSIIGRHEKKFVVIVAQTEEKARQYLRNIKDALLNSKLLRNDFGSFEEPRDEWRASAINIPKFKARIAVVSVGQNIRGYIHGSNRPDLMIFDDIEDTQSAKTKEARDKTFNWLTREAFSAGDTSTRVIIVGNKVHEDASVMRMKEMISEGKWSGIYREYPIVDSRGRPLWTGKYPDKRAVGRERKRIGNELAFRREFLLEIVPEDGQLVFREMIHYYDTLPDTINSNFKFSALGVDLAISEKKSADYTAVVCASVFGSGRERKIFIHPRPLNKRIGFPETIEHIKGISRSIGQGVPAIIFVESVGYQLSAVEQLRHEGFPAEPFLPRGNDKRTRLATITSLLELGQILFPKKGAERLVDQLLGFGTERHDDLVDAFTLLVHKIIERDQVGPPKHQYKLIN